MGGDCRSHHLEQHAAEQGLEDVIAARLKWRAVQKDLDPLKLVLLDETGHPLK